AEGRTVYLHCLKGKGRSASVAEAYLLHQDILQSDLAAREAEAQLASPLYRRPFQEVDAYNQIRQHRPQAAPNAEQRESVRDYSVREMAAVIDARRRAR
ncbi:MAG: hypothetical protein ACHQT8_07520, partial [Chlamydiales bacterium]